MYSKFAIDTTVDVRSDKMQWTGYVLLKAEHSNLVGRCVLKLVVPPEYPSFYLGIAGNPRNLINNDSEAGVFMLIDENNIYNDCVQSERQYRMNKIQVTKKCSLGVGCTFMNCNTKCNAKDVITYFEQFHQYNGHVGAEKKNSYVSTFRGSVDTDDLKVIMEYQRKALADHENRRALRQKSPATPKRPSQSPPAMKIARSVATGSSWAGVAGSGDTVQNSTAYVHTQKDMVISTTAVLLKLEQRATNARVGAKSQFAAIEKILSEVEDDIGKEAADQLRSAVESTKKTMLEIADAITEERKEYDGTKKREEEERKRKVAELERRKKEIRDEITRKAKLEMEQMIAKLEAEAEDTAEVDDQQSGTWANAPIDPKDAGTVTDEDEDTGGEV